MRARVRFRIGRRNGLARAPVVDAEDTQRPRAELSGKASAILRLNNIVGVVEADRGLEVAAVFNKERPYLREVGRKALVWNSRVVDPNLAEIRIDGGVEDQAVVQDELCIQP